MMVIIIVVGVGLAVTICMFFVMLYSCDCLLQYDVSTVSSDICIHTVSLLEGPGCYRGEVKLHAWWVQE
jgi:hypothetical protein